MEIAIVIGVLVVGFILYGLIQSFKHNAKARKEMKKSNPNTDAVAESDSSSLLYAFGALIVVCVLIYLFYKLYVSTNG